MALTQNNKFFKLLIYKVWIVPGTRLADKTVNGEKSSHGNCCALPFSIYKLKNQL